MIMKEIWKEVQGYEGLYEISNYGIIKGIERECPYNKRKLGGKPKSQRSDKDGYRIVTLCKDCIKKNFKVHRLVAINFLENKNNFPMVNHIDGDKANNHVSNLEWCNQSHNEKHAYKTGLKSHVGENHNNSKLTNDMVRIIKNSKTLSQYELAEIFNVTQTNISHILSGKTWTHIS
jgi:predicted XRE-type DNA-binding protein